jgi:hypothetical protein
MVSSMTCEAGASSAEAKARVHQAQGGEPDCREKRREFGSAPPAAPKAGQCDEGEGRDHCARRHLPERRAEKHVERVDDPVGGPPPDRNDLRRKAFGASRISRLQAQGYALADWTASARENATDRIAPGPFATSSAPPSCPAKPRMTAKPEPLRFRPRRAGGQTRPVIADRQPDPPRIVLRQGHFEKLALPRSEDVLGRVDSSLVARRAIAVICPTVSAPQRMSSPAWTGRSRKVSVRTARRIGSMPPA